MMQPNVEHPYEILVIIRPSLKKICNNDACQAAAFNHILYWIARKAKGQPKEKIQAGEFFWYGTTEAITEDLADSWGVCKVRHEVNNLLSAGLLGKGRNKQWGADRTKFFHFGKEQCAKLLELCNEHHICLLHIGLPAEVLHLIISSNANDESIKCFCSQMMNPSNASLNLPGQMINPSEHSMNSSLPFDKSIEAITQITTQIDISDKVTTSNVGDIETFVASATPPHDFSNLYESFNDDPHQGNVQNDIPLSTDPAKGSASPTPAGRIIASDQGNAYRTYPGHPFILLDNLERPTVMIVTLTPAFPHPLSSEMEDKRRERIAAWEILPTYKKQGLEVEVRWEHETEQQTVDAAATTVVESTVLEGGNTQAQQLHDLFDQWNQEPAIDDYPTEFERTQMRETDHTAIPEPSCSATDGLTQESPVTTHSETTSSESPLQTQERPSSAQGVDESNRQATGQQQANGDNPIATGTIENSPATKKSRGGKKETQPKPEKPKKAKPAISEEELTLRKEVHAWVNQRRGYSLQNRATTKQIIDENTACITLGHMLYAVQYEQNTEEGCTWDDLSFVWDHSIKNDKYWSQPNNKSRFGAHALLQMFAQTIVKRKPNNVTPMRPVNNPPAQQEPTPEKAASIAAAEAVMARLKQRQAI